MQGDPPNSDVDTHSATDALPSQPPPIPPRYRWLKRLAVSGVCLLVALVGLRLWWGYEANRRLQRQLDQYRSAGELVTAADFDRMLDAVPKADNAAVLLEEAITRMRDISVSGVTLVQAVGDLSKLKEQTAFQTGLYQALAPVLRIVRAAGSRPVVAWSQRLGSGLAGFSPGPWSDRRNLGKVLWFAAFFQFQHGDHAAAVETLQDVLFLSEAVAAHPALISNLNAWSNQRRNFDLVERFGARIAFPDNHEPSDGPTCRATRGQVRKLIETLLDDSKSRAALTQAFYGERAYEIDFIDFADRMVRQAGLLSHSCRAITRPLEVLRTVRSTKLRTKTAEAAASADCPGALAALGDGPKTDPSNEPFVDWLSRAALGMRVSGSLESSRRCIVLHFRNLARRRMAAIALAIRMYQLDNGRRPAKLSQLVPDYLPSVPVDPFAAAGASIRYRPDTDHPVLYSVDHNGVDNGGLPRFHQGRRTDEDRTDDVFYLDGKPDRVDDAGTPSTQAADDDEDKEDDDG
ncbi:MAG: hypothetical protein GY778_03765 [bacterium]|nr:hypothetical protein [bacterium]